MFEKGQAIVHPSHGAGIVLDIHTMNFDGEEQPYYRIELLHGGMLMIPTGQAEGVGCRHVTDHKTIFNVLMDTPAKLDSNYRSRQADLDKKLRSGDACQIAEALRDLAWHSQENKLSTRDMKYRYKARQFLSTELAVQLDNDVDSAGERLDGVLEEALSSMVS